jgi:hypothetical protein
VGFQEMGRVVFFKLSDDDNPAFHCSFCPPHDLLMDALKSTKWVSQFFLLLLSFLLFCRIPRNMSCGFQLMVLSSLMMTILLSFSKETVVLMFGINRLGRTGMLVWCGMHSHQLECAWTI